MTSVVQEERCTGCGGPISVWEEGRCAFCRSDDRGDNQLLAHDSRGYLDEDGVTRIPCGCGCERPVIVPEPRDMELDETLARHCELKAAALRTIREATLTVRELEPA